MGTTASLWPLWSLWYATLIYADFLLLLFLHEHIRYTIWLSHNCDKNMRINSVKFFYSWKLSLSVLSGGQTDDIACTFLQTYLWYFSTAMCCYLSDNIYANTI